MKNEVKNPEILKKCQVRNEELIDFNAWRSERRSKVFLPDLGASSRPPSVYQKTSLTHQITLDKALGYKEAF